MILFLIALAIRLGVILFWQFDGLYGQDAYAYLQQALAIIHNLPQGQPPPPDFFWPNGYPLLIAFFTLFAGQTAWAGQLAALLSGAALPSLVFLLYNDLFPCSIEFDSNSVIRSNLGGLWAGLIVVFAGQPLLSSVVIMADMPALFWATLAAWLVVRAVHSEQRSRGAEGQGRIFSSVLSFLAAGAALALAVISRWLYILVAPALGLYIIFNYWNTRQGLKAGLALPKAWWVPALAAVLSGSIILAPQLGLSLNKPEGLAHSWLLGWSPANFLRREFENIDGHFIYQLPNWIFYAQPAGHPAYIFPLLGLASAWGVWRLGRARQWGPLILLPGWAAPVYLFLAGIPYQNFRFGLTLYLPLVLLTGFGLNDLFSSGAGLRGGRGEFTPVLLRLHSPAVLKTIAALSLVGTLAWAYPMLNSFLTVQNRTKIIARQVEQALPQEASLITFGLTLTVQHYTRLKVLELFFLDQTSLKTLAGSSDPLYLLLDLPGIETQWRGKTPQLNYQWLKENRKLIKIGEFPPYTLFKVAR
ncbi:MAG: phospholipid carrier-dependent glycosyltransferase [Anaerolineae bacterium]|nr:phospholipid carrier-dependent glycosyltransferase [Anaerolineae bacterium]